MRVAVLTLLVFAFVGFPGVAPQATHGRVYRSLQTLLRLLKLLIPNQLNGDPNTTVIDNRLISGTIQHNLTLSGLRSLDFTIIERHSYDTVTINIDLDFRKLDVDIDLAVNLHGLIDIEDVHAHVKLDISDVKFQINIGMPLDESHLDDFNLLITVGDTAVDVQGIGSEKLSQTISEILTENVPKIFDAIAKGLSEPVSRIIKLIVNIIFRD